MRFQFNGKTAETVGGPFFFFLHDKNENKKYVKSIQ